MATFIYDCCMNWTCVLSWVVIQYVVELDCHCTRISGHDSKTFANSRIVGGIICDLRSIVLHIGVVDDIGKVVVALWLHWRDSIAILQIQTALGRHEMRPKVKGSSFRLCKREQDL